MKLWPVKRSAYHRSGHEMVRWMSSVSSVSPSSSLTPLGNSQQPPPIALFAKRYQQQSFQQLQQCVAGRNNDQILDTTHLFTTGMTTPSHQSNSTSRLTREMNVPGLAFNAAFVAHNDWILPSRFEGLGHAVAERDERMNEDFNEPTPSNTIVWETMNRNARRPKRANHGSRPCSRIKRRERKNELGRRKRF